LLVAGLGFQALFAPEAEAGISIHLASGFSSLHVQAGTVAADTGAAPYDKEGGIGAELREQVNIEFPSLNSAFDIYYQGRFGSSIGSFPLSRTGGGLSWYPWGLPLQFAVLDNGVSFSRNHFAPFLTGQVALSSVAITDIDPQSNGNTEPNNARTFNGLTIGYQVGGGAELPLTQSWSLVVELLYEGTLSGGSSGGESSSIKFNAVNGILGIALHP
jgi:opacity protein-like surface antigen